jgi:hypothetical protein
VPTVFAFMHRKHHNNAGVPRNLENSLE